MKTAFCLLVLGSLAGCSQHVAPAGKPSAASLVGTWQLVGYQSASPANSLVPNQRLTLDSARHFQFFDAGRLTAEGTYALATGSACGGGTSTAPLLQVTPATPNGYAPHGNYTLRGDSLVIDQCLAADGPRFTFRRQLPSR